MGLHVWCLLLGFWLALFGSEMAFGFSEDVEALLMLKEAITDPTGRLSDWKDGRGSHCEWTGVSCGADDRVVGLDISGMNLSGVVSSQVQRLSALERLNLCCNAFSTPLPERLDNLTRLVELDLSHNYFVGSFPRGLGAAKGLLNVSAYSNNFTGPLPEDFSEALEYLDLRGSFFEGEIPPSFGKLKRLRFLGLSGNNLTGKIPVEIGQMESLRWIMIGYNRLNGSIPAEIGNLTDLEYLDLSNCYLEGNMPRELGGLQQLHTLFLYRNLISGTLPKELGNCSSMMSFDASDNFLVGRIPPELGNLRHLRLLSLMFNQLSGNVPEEIGELPALRTLEVWNNSLSGHLPQKLGRNSPLEWLDVSSNSLSGPIPPDLCHGNNLTKLLLFNNKFTGSFPARLTSCRSLWRVRMHNNFLSGPLPLGLGRLPNLTRLELTSNRFSGFVPADLGSAPSLSFVDFSFNRLSGSLPLKIFSMSSLQRFYAAENNISGPMPRDFGLCRYLSVLNLSANHISGEIPGSGIRACEKLVALDFRQNELTGPIPPELATMPALAVLDLSRNFLTGNIPPRFGSSAALEIFNVSYNELSGTVPVEGMFRTVNRDCFVGNSALCGGVMGVCERDSVHQRTVPPSPSWVFALMAVASVLITVATVGYALRRRRRCLSPFESRRDRDDWPWRLTAFQRLNFTCGDILSAVKENKVIGMGSTGTVYKADFLNRSVAVKKLWKTQSELDGSPSEPAFIAEVDLLGNLRHRNILRLLGYCYNDVNALLIYEYMPNGSLADALHGKSACNNLLADWVTRYNIAVGIAQGLSYLHHDCSPVVVHRDVKSNNILLDANMEARVADFGLAKLINGNESMSVVAGSYGYIAPEYAYTLKVDEKSDIYSFGVVLMELLTGRKPVEPEFGEAVNIVEWMRNKAKTKEGMVEALDCKVGAMCRHVQEEMILVLRIALLCTSRLPRERPSMRDVVTMLAEAKPRRKSNASPPRRS